MNNEAINNLQNAFCLLVEKRFRSCIHFEQTYRGEFDFVIIHRINYWNSQFIVLIFSIDLFIWICLCKMIYSVLKITSKLNQFKKVPIKHTIHMENASCSKFFSFYFLVRPCLVIVLISSFLFILGENLQVNQIGPKLFPVLAQR